MKIGITGAYGQFGWHLRCRLLAEHDIDVRSADRAEFESEQCLAEFVEGCDAIVHLAGVNRASDQEIARKNPELAEQLAKALNETGTKAHVLYASSTQIENDGVYGRAKKQAGEILERCTRKAGLDYSEFVFPHLFGEHARPFYNSVVSTFCHQVAQGESPAVNGNGQVELIHFQDASEMILAAVKNKKRGRLRPSGKVMTVEVLLERITALAGSYKGHIIPDLRDPLNLRLFNTYRSYLYPAFYPQALITHRDDRGALTELVKSDNGGQTFFSTTKPGTTRGNHFHYHKVERFMVVEGRARIKIRRLLTEDKQEFIVSGDEVKFIDMPTLHTHNITNIGANELVTLFWSHEIFDKNNPDTVFEQV